MKLATALAVLMIWASASACTTTYDVVYGFRLEGSEAGAPLETSDGAFSFKFWPNVAGIEFVAKNLTEDDASLDWDQSFFVQPDGNTYKALNTDVLDEANEIVMKSRYSSIIPAGAKLHRFTSATVRAEKLGWVSISEVGTQVANSRLQWSESEASWLWTGTTSHARTTSILVGESWRAWPYFPMHFSVNSELEVPAALDDLADKLRSGATMGLGLTISHKGAERAYRFKFSIDRVFVIANVLGTRDEDGELKKELRYVLSAEDDWAWIDLREPEEDASSSEDSSGL